MVMAFYLLVRKFGTGALSPGLQIRRMIVVGSCRKCERSGLIFRDCVKQGGRKGAEVVGGVRQVVVLPPVSGC